MSSRIDRTTNIGKFFLRSPKGVSVDLLLDHLNAMRKLKPLVPVGDLSKVEKEIETTLNILQIKTKQEA